MKIGIYREMESKNKNKDEKQEKGKESVATEKHTPKFKEEHRQGSGFAGLLEQWIESDPFL